MIRKSYIKDGKVRSFQVDDERVYTTLEIGGQWVSNPTLTDFLADGWSEYIAPVPEPYIPTYAELVEQYIREHGYETYGAELAVLNNYSENPSEYLESWQHYQGVRHEAKIWAQSQPHRDE